MSIAPAHSRMNINLMFDWLKQLDDAAVNDLPSVPDVMGRFGFESPEQARTLIACLCDEDKIRIDRSQKMPTFIIKDAAYRAPHRPAPAKQPGPVPDRAGVARLKDIAAKMAEPKNGAVVTVTKPVAPAPVKEISPPVEKPRAVSAPVAVEPDPKTWEKCGHPLTGENTKKVGKFNFTCKQCWDIANAEKVEVRAVSKRIKVAAAELPLPEPAPQIGDEYAPHPPTLIIRVTGTVPAGHRCVAFPISSEIREWMGREAEKEGFPEYSWEMARDLFIEGVNARMNVKQGRPLIRGKVLRAWHTHEPDLPLPEFVTYLLDLGLDAYEKMETMS